VNKCDITIIITEFLNSVYLVFQKEQCAIQSLGSALSIGTNCTGGLPPFHLRMETDPGSETVCPNWNSEQWARSETQ
jgi:hypothetical protein